MAGGKRNASKKKQHSRRPAPATTLGQDNTVQRIDVRGGGSKARALQLATGRFRLGKVTATCPIGYVAYHPNDGPDCQLANSGVLAKSVVVRVDVEPLAEKLQEEELDRLAPDLAHGLAVITSRPGKSGRADGYILLGEELAFYLAKR